MFGKIKNKLKSVFEKQEEVIEDLDEDLNQLEEQVVQLENDKISDRKLEDNQNINFQVNEVDLEEKKGFFSKIFKKKDKEEIKNLEHLEDEMLEDVSIKEKLEIEEGKNLSNDEIKNNILKVDKKIEFEDELEKDLLNTIEKNSKIEFEDDFVENKLKNNQLNENEFNNKLEDEINKKEESFFSKTVKKLKSKKIDENNFEKIWIELEIFLLEINIAFEIVEKIEGSLKEALIGNSFNRFKLNEKIKQVLSEEVEKVLIDREADLIEKIKQIKDEDGLVKILILGVNGTGKTTSIAKFVNYLQKQNFSVVVAAADTFRAAAIEQLEEHSKKLKFKLISHKGGSDPAAVAFDAIDHAKAKNKDIVLIDTAGRMPNNSNLMNELQKIKRIAKSQITIFVGDSISGNDLIEQINLFNEGIKIDGVILTKVDTDERPCSIVTVAYSITKPIYFLGTGQNYDDLIKFDAKEIADKLFSLNDD